MTTVRIEGLTPKRESNAQLS